MIHFHTPDNWTDRQKQPALTKEEQENAVNLINWILYSDSEWRPSQEGVDIIQRFVTDYENLDYYRTITDNTECIGEDGKPFILKFKPNLTSPGQ